MPSQMVPFPKTGFHCRYSSSAWSTPRLGSPAHTPGKIELLARVMMKQWMNDRKQCYSLSLVTVFVNCTFLGHWILFMTIYLYSKFLHPEWARTRHCMSRDTANRRKCVIYSMDQIYGYIPNFVNEHYQSYPSEDETHLSW